MLRSRHGCKTIWNSPLSSHPNTSIKTNANCPLRTENCSSFSSKVEMHAIDWSHHIQWARNEFENEIHFRFCRQWFKLNIAFVDVRPNWPCIMWWPELYLCYCITCGRTNEWIWPGRINCGSSTKAAAESKGLPKLVKFGECDFCLGQFIIIDGLYAATFSAWHKPKPWGVLKNSSELCFHVCRADRNLVHPLSLFKSACPIWWSLRCHIE